MNSSTTRRAETTSPGGSRALIHSSLALALLALMPLLPRVEAEAGEEDGREAWLGVEVQRLDASLRDAFDFDGNGVVVSRVVPGSPAHEAGIREGDILVGIDGQRVQRPADLQRLIRGHEPGDRVDVRCFRKGETREIGVPLGARSERRERGDRESPGPVPWPRPSETLPSVPGVEPFFLHGHLDRGYLGTRVARLGADLAEYFEVNPDSGVLVLEVEEDSPAAKAGVRAGDVIVKFGDKRVRTPGELTRAVRSEKPGTAVNLTVVRQGRDREIEVTLAGHPGMARMRDLALKGREELAPLLDDLGERLDEGRDALSERLERLETLVEELRRKIEERED